MEVLKRVLTVMVIILGFIIAAGGLYLSRMGNMDHGQAPVVAIGTEKQNSQSASGEKQENVDESKDNQDSNTKNSGASGEEQKENQAIQGPVIVQVPVQEPKADPRVYVDQLKQRLKDINKANSNIAANSGGETVAQPNGATAPGTGNMNNLHQEFYSLGQNVAEMEYVLENLTDNINDAQSQQPVGGAANGQNVQQNPYVGQYYGNQQPGQSIDQQGNLQTNQQTNQQQAHTSQGTGLLSAETMKLVLSLILVVSIIFGIISVVGFIGSIFKENVPKQIA